MKILIQIRSSTNVLTCSRPLKVLIPLNWNNLNRIENITGTRSVIYWNFSGSISSFWALGKCKLHSQWCSIRFCSTSFRSLYGKSVFYWRGIARGFDHRATPIQTRSLSDLLVSTSTTHKLEYDIFERSDISLATTKNTNNFPLKTGPLMLIFFYLSIITIMLNLVKLSWREQTCHFVFRIPSCRGIQRLFSVKYLFGEANIA